jgi:multidrug efflux pump subunit AcrA (membrane-fusion protein)
MELDAAQAAVENSQAQYDYQQAILERMVITAPSAPLGTVGQAEAAGGDEPPVIGEIEQLAVEIGDYVSADELVATIVDISRLKVVVPVSERDVVLLVDPANDQPPRVEIDAVDRTVEGRVVFVPASADPRTRTFDAEIAIDNPDRRIRAQMVARVHLVRQVHRDALLAPLEAVVRTETGYEVYVVNAGRAEARPVALGPIRGQAVRLLPLPPDHPDRGPDYRPVAPGELLIVNDPRLVSPGQRVNIEPPVDAKLAAETGADANQDGSP